MKRKNLLLILPFLLASCNKANTSSSSSSFMSINESFISDTVIKSPNEDKGLEGNHDGDEVIKQDTKVLEDFLTKVAKETKYSYELNVQLNGYSEHFINYYTPHAFYEENDDPSSSLGYGETLNGNYMFKYYLSEDGKEVYPSIYEYGGYENSKVQGLYTPITLANFTMLKDVISSLEAINVSTNKFLITNMDVASIFQYMTTYGSSITSYMSAVYIDIIDLDSLKFEATVELGELGKIVGKYQKEETTKIDFVNDLISRGLLTGVDYYDDTKTFFQDLVKSDNYIMEGIYQSSEDGKLTDIPYTIYCNKNYFYFSYNKKMLGDSYNDFGYVFVPKNTSISYRNYLENGTYEIINQTLAYDSCYGFTNENGEFYFNEFIGPIESNNMKYLEVDSLPESGDSNILYITFNENGEKVVYEWKVISISENGEEIYGWNLYSSWYDCIGDFYFTNVTATFYLSGTALLDIGPSFFEKDLNKENTYYSYDTGITSSIANSIFKVGFQPTDTWMDYVKKANLVIEKDMAGNIIGGDIGLSILASRNDGETKLHDIYYKIKDFGKGNIDICDKFLEGIIGA